MSIRRKLTVGAAAVALITSGTAAAAAAAPASTPNFTGIYLSTWGTAHVAFSDAFRAWLAATGASVTAQAPLVLDADRGGFTLPASPTDADVLDDWGRIVYPGTLLISVPTKAREGSHEARRIVRFGPLYIKVVPEVSWNAGLSLDGARTVGEVELATADYAEVLAGGGTPSPSGFRAVSVPFHLTQDAADLLAHASGRTAPAAGSLAAGSLLGTLTPSFDHVPTQG